MLFATALSLLTDNETCRNPQGWQSDYPQTHIMSEFGSSVVIGTILAFKPDNRHERIPT